MRRMVLVCLCVFVLLSFTACKKEDTPDHKTESTYNPALRTTECLDTPLTSITQATHATKTTTHKDMTNTVEVTNRISFHTSTTSKETTVFTKEAITTTYKGTVSTTERIDCTSPSNSPTQPKNAVFCTKNITRITLYAYYGQGKGSEVPSENMSEIVNWLGSFTVGEKAPYPLAPGTNTYHVEIEYSDGTAIKQGLDVIVIEGTVYDLNGNQKPDCFMDILSKTSAE